MAAKPSVKTKMLTDPVRALVRARITERGLTLNDASTAIGKHRSYLAQYLGSPQCPREFPTAVAVALAKVLDVPAAALSPNFNEGGENNGKVNNPTRHRVMPGVYASLPPTGAPPPIGMRLRTLDDAGVLPLFADTDAIDIDLSAEEGLIKIPAEGTRRAAFGLWLTIPRGRLRPGDLTFVSSRQPPRVGDSVVVLRDGRVQLIGDLTHVDHDKVCVREDQRDIVFHRSGAGQARILKIVACVFP